MTGEDWSDKAPGSDMLFLSLSNRLGTGAFIDTLFWFPDMNETKTYDSFPLRYVLAANAVNLSIYALGAVIVAPVGWWAAALYLVFCGAVEAHVLTKSCVDCFYYGKTCGFGKGRACALLFKKGDPARFAAREIGWSALIPDFAVLLIPVIVGGAMLVIDFHWWRAVLVGALIFISFAGNAAIHIGFGCRYCRQREIGCPAERLFSKSG
jgi:hypothetical protein